MVKQKSLKLNMVLNAIKGMLSVIFPLITFPYVSRVLGVENLGKYTYASSIIGYFVLLAGLGISTYAIREGARIRENRNELDEFVGEVFSINIISTLISYLFFFILLLLDNNLQGYEQLLILLSLQIFFTTIGVEWVYSIFEDYLFITLRSIVFQLISIALLFLLVHDKNDLYRYAVVGLSSIVGTGLLNLFYSKKYCKVKFTFSLNIKKHIKPIFILFGMAITIVIYVSSDTTILGVLCGDYNVGIYSVSVKIYTIVKTILSSILVVSIPRLSALIGEKKTDEFRIVSEDIYKTLLTVLMPSIVGLIVLRKQIILLIAGEEFMQATSSMLLLALALLFCQGAWFWGQCVLVPAKKEKTVFLITVISALLNIVLNIFLIPMWKENAAAFTTIVAEAVSFFMCWYYGRKYVRMSGVVKILIKVLVGCAGILVVSEINSTIFGDGIIYIVTTISFSIVVYFGIELVLKNESINNIKSLIKSKAHLS